MKALTIACGVLATCLSPAGGQPGTLPVQIDFAKPIGRLKALHGVNGGPRTVGRHSGDMVTLHKEAGFPSVRLHDCNWPHPDVVDIPTIFPLFHLDADDPKNYRFAMKAFQQFLQGPKRVAVAGAPEKTEITVGAGLSEGGTLAKILASNFRSEEQRLRIDLRHLPWKGPVEVKSWRIDEDHEFLAEQPGKLDPDDPVLNLPLPAGTVLLAELQPLSTE